MKNNELSTAYRYDGDGFFDGFTAWQWLDGDYIRTDNATLQCPWGDADEPDGAVFYRFTGTTWETVAKPKGIADLEGVKVKRTAESDHERALFEIAKSFEGTEGYTQEQDDGFMWFAKIPEPTQEELEERAMEEEVKAIEEKAEEIKGRLMVAFLNGDDAQIKALRAEYKTLMES